MVNQIRALWAGELPLPVAFWRFGVAWGLVINGVTSVMTIVTVLAEAPVWVLVPVHLLPLPYNVIALIGIWRSAARYDGEEKWADLARLVAFLGLTLLSLT